MEFKFNPIILKNNQSVEPLVNGITQIKFRDLEDVGITDNFGFDLSPVTIIGIPGYSKYSIQVRYNEIVPYNPALKQQSKDYYLNIFFDFR